MKIIKGSKQLQEERNRIEGRSIGLVPTMGALHSGHVSLVERSLNDNNITIVSIFVNPTQFNNPDDLEKYPRTLDNDIEILSSELGRNDIVFVPENNDIYNYEKPYNINLGKLDRVMEGEHRPGHFKGVVRIVRILFDLCRPSAAYFGRKDFQQMAVIRQLVLQGNYNINIVACPIVREENGLAMSSRNERLPAEVRRKAGIIFKTLSENNKQQLPVDIQKLKEKIISQINEAEPFRVEYFEIVDDDKLEPLNHAGEIEQNSSYTGCIAVYANDVRLIDNTEFSFLFSKG
ncbi:MAG: pantoate--beta-alanine ligase [Bacteroidales bacterium]|nr:pantoate--beta-alanine ligase [Bacteroidales bacterium]